MSDNSTGKPKIKLAIDQGGAQHANAPPKVGTESTKSHPDQIDSEAASIPKPSSFDLDKFKSRRAPAVAGVETLQTALPHYRIAQAKDFVRLHPDEDNYWSPELCFVAVPVKGERRETLHLINEELAVRYLPSA